MEEKINSLVESFYQKGYAMSMNFFNPQQIEELLLVLLQHEAQMKNAGIGKKENHTHAKEIRGDRILWLEKGMNSALDALFYSAMDDICLAINRRCFLGLNSSEFHFAKYEPGTFYKRHKDIFNSDDARKISLLIYLNTKWTKGDGGELKIYNEESITVEPKAGTLVIFESHMEHEVLLSHANRYSITGWLKNETLVL